MKNIIRLAVIILFVSSCKGQQKETSYDPIVLKAKETSLYTAQIDWETVNRKYIELTNGAEDIDGMKEGLQYLVNSLGDKHATIRSPKDYAIIVYYTGEVDKEEESLKIDHEYRNTVINDVSAKFSYQLMENGVGYLKVVGIGAGDVKEQSDVIRNGLVALKAKGVDKWIVDLRFNGGGNMEPMLSGLAPLVGAGFIGGAVNSNNEIWPYTIKNGEFDNYGRLVCEMDSLPKIASTEKVAVLLSRYTISSGEMTAIAFKGRDHTKFIGEPTAGYTTGNGFDVVTDDVALVISKNIFIDRNKNKYEAKVAVDEQVEFQHHVALKDDNQIKSAIAWLNE